MICDSELYSSLIFDADFNDIESKFLFKIFVKKISSSIPFVVESEDEGIWRLFEFIKIGYGHKNWACNFIKTNGKFSAGTEKTLSGLAKNETKSKFKWEAKAPKNLN